MPIINGEMKKVRRTKPVVFFIENTLNTKKIKAIEHLLETVKKRFIKYSDDFIEYKFFVISFAGTTNSFGGKLLNVSDVCPAQYLNKNKIDASDFLEVLNLSLSRKGLFQSNKGGYTVPHIYLLSDGDSDYINIDYLKTNLNDNKWFQRALRRVIVFGKPTGTTDDLFSQFAVDFNNYCVINDEESVGDDLIGKIADFIFKDTTFIESYRLGYVNSLPKFSDFFNDDKCNMKNNM